MTKPVFPIDSITTKCGDIITFYVTAVNNKPWFRIEQQNRFSASSYYDGDDVSRAKEIYCDLLLVFKGIKSMEEFSKRDLTNDIKKLNLTVEREKKDLSFMQLKSDPLFLGINDFGF
jgi:hypothetical protein